jgi:hypothetical protein
MQARDIGDETRIRKLKKLCVDLEPRLFWQPSRIRAPASLQAVAGVLAVCFLLHAPLVR